MNHLPAYARFVLIALGIGLLILAMVIGRDLLLPLGWALLLALLILPLQKKMERLVRYRALAAVLSVLVLVLVGSGVVYLLSSQLVNLINDLPGLFRKLSGFLDEVRVYIDEQLGIPYQKQPSELADRFSSFLQERIDSIGQALTSTIKTVIYLGILPVYIFFILYYRERITLFLRMVYPAGKREAAVRTVWKASGVVQKYLGGMVIVTFVVAILVLVLFLSMGIKHALFFAVFVAVFNLIPYVGVFIASVVSILYVFITKDALIYPFLTFVLLWGIQLLENNLITPFIVGKQVQLNPLAVILVIILGGMIWGVSGMILFIPMLGGIKVVLDEIPGLRPYGFLLGDDPPDAND